MNMKKISDKSLYSVHPGVAMMQKWVLELPAKTGHSIEEWIALVNAEGPATEKERRERLKEEHQLGTNSAWWIAERSFGRGEEESSPEAYLKAAEANVEAMFAGAKSGLRPVYDRLLKLGLSLGKDVKVCPCKTIIPLYRERVFAQIKPTTRTRIDLSFALGDLNGLGGSGRLVANKNWKKGDRLTHLIAISGSAHIVAGSIEAFLLVVNGQMGAWHAFAGFAVPALLGNIVGGTILFALLSHAQVMREI